MAVSSWDNIPGASPELSSLAVHSCITCITSLLTLGIIIWREVIRDSGKRNIAALGTVPAGSKADDANCTERCVRSAAHGKVPCDQESSQSVDAADRRLGEKVPKEQHEELVQQHKLLKEQHDAVTKELEECRHKQEKAQTEAKSLQADHDERAERARRLLHDFKLREKQDFEDMQAELDEGPVAVPPTSSATFIRPGQPRQEEAPPDPPSDSDMVADERRAEPPRSSPASRPAGSRPVRRLVELGEAFVPDTEGFWPSAWGTSRPSFSTEPHVHAARPFEAMFSGSSVSRVPQVEPTTDTTEDPASVIREVLARREREMTNLQSLLQAAQQERVQFQERALSTSCALHDERKHAAGLQTEVSTLTADLGSLGEHVKELEEECLSCQVQVESVSREKAVLKEQLIAAQETCSRLQDQSQLHAEELSSKEAALTASAHALSDAQIQLQDMRRSVGQLQSDLNSTTAALTRSRQRMFELESDSHAVRRVAELLAQNAAETDAPQERRRAAQRRLLVCLHPDKCPATQIATQLTQEVQRTRWWVN